MFNQWKPAKESEHISLKLSVKGGVPSPSFSEWLFILQLVVPQNAECICITKGVITQLHRNMFTLQVLKEG